MSTHKHLPKLSVLVEEGRARSGWDLGNDVLYKLCRDHPMHEETSAIIAKVWLIGRSYAVAIERRRVKRETNDSFYAEIVAPRMRNSGIDSWISEAKRLRGHSDEAVTVMLATHAKVTQLFGKISGLNKRSLASKYLHFHVPKLFYIYDTRAVQAMSAFSSHLGHMSSRGRTGDKEYRRFVERCLRLRALVQTRLGLSLTPRELDKMLLRVHASNKRHGRYNRQVRL